jgi:2-methylisocitrate lyase-like PEP mutase family enzyme
MSPIAQHFAQLHIPGNPLILYNIWDAGSAIAVAKAGAKAIATGSWGVACAHGASDGERLSLDLALANVERTIAVTDLPVTLDMESGYGQDAQAVGTSVARAAALGVAGINIEDKDPVTRTLFSTDVAASRIAAAAKSGVFINARVDAFILTPAQDHDAALVDAVIERARAYAAAGASGLFVPFLETPALIERLCKASPLPVNIMMRPSCPPHKKLAELGVARISHGHGPWAEAMERLEADARHLYQNWDA